MSSRALVFDYGDGLEIQIPTTRHWFGLFFLAVWLVAWSFAGALAFSKIPEQPLVLVWLIGWAFGACLVSYLWLWIAFGKEIIKVENGMLLIRKDILGLGRTKSYDASEVRDLRAAGYFPGAHQNKWEAMGLSGGVIAFEHVSKTHRFGVGLEEAEARSLADEIRRYLPEQENR